MQSPSLCWPQRSFEASSNHKRGHLFWVCIELVFCDCQLTPTNTHNLQKEDSSVERAFYLWIKNTKSIHWGELPLKKYQLKACSQSRFPVQFVVGILRQSPKWKDIKTQYITKPKGTANNPAALTSNFHKPLPTSCGFPLPKDPTRYMFFGADVVLGCRERVVGFFVKAGNE